MMLLLYGHRFSSFTWKVLIALYANATPFAWRELLPEHPENFAFVAAHGGPQGRFPVLVDGDRTLFESTGIIEHLAVHHPGHAPLIPRDADAGIAARTLDRVFDQMQGAFQAIIAEHFRAPGAPDPARCAEARARLVRSYAWLENWLEAPRQTAGITLVECSAAPALFYADWIAPIGDAYPRLKAWRAALLALPPVARCVEEARPFRHLFPGGAPDRD